MADEPQGQETQATPVAEPEDKGRVPYDRFEQVTKENKEFRDRLAQLERERDELADRDKSESERLRAQFEREQKERERLAQEVAERDQQLSRVERSQWVRAAAHDHRFNDPEDAVALVNLGEIEDERSAQQAVKKLADRKKHLVAQEPEIPQIGQVLNQGQPATPEQAAALEQARQQQDGQAFVDELREALSRNRVSIPGLLDQ